MELFSSIADCEKEMLSLLLDGLLAFDARAATEVMQRAIRLTDPLPAVRAAVQHNFTLVLGREDLRRIGSALVLAGDEDGQQIVRFLGSMRSPSAIQVLLDVLDKVSVPIREEIITVLGETGLGLAAVPLIKMLNGEMAGKAARALAAIGAREALEPIKKALKAAPAEQTIDLISSLVTLGEKDIIWSDLEACLRHPAVEVRLEAIWLLGKIGGDKARSLLNKAVQDWDRQVSLEAQKILDSTK